AGVGPAGGHARVSGALSPTNAGAKPDTDSPTMLPNAKVANATPTTPAPRPEHRPSRREVRQRGRAIRPLAQRRSQRHRRLALLLRRGERRMPQAEEHHFWWQPLLCAL